MCVFCISCSNDDSSGNTNAQSQITQILEDNIFIISSFVDSNVDETAQFACYAFEFNSNGTVIASSQNDSYSGTWSITNDSSDDDATSDNDLDFNINFNLTNDFEDLNDDWDIVTYNSTMIELIDVSGGNGGTDNLIFQVGTPADNCTSGLQSEIESNLQSGSWRITEFIDSGNDETNTFSGYDFTFNSNGELIASDGSNDFVGTWSLINEGNSSSLEDLELKINFDVTNDFEDLNDDWDFVTQTSTEIQLIDISGGNGGTDELTFEKN